MLKVTPLGPQVYLPMLKVFLQQPQIIDLMLKVMGLGLAELNPTLKDFTQSLPVHYHMLRVIPQ
jgi:hypothetical protein